MSIGDSKYRSRKWRLAKASLAAVTLFAGFSLVMLAADGGDAALIIGAWAASDGGILGLYAHYNVKEKAA